MLHLTSFKKRFSRVGPAPSMPQEISQSTLDIFEIPTEETKLNRWVKKC